MQQHKYDKWPIEIIHRSKITEHPFNPRRITPAAKKRLKSSLDKNGFLDVLTWNKRTGRLLSGHQRLKVMDATSETKDDYTVTCRVVDLEEKDEAAPLIAMNNSQAQGEFEFDQLAEMLRGMEADSLDATGFDSGTLHSLFGTEVTEHFPEVQQEIEKAADGFAERRSKSMDKKLDAEEQLYATAEDRMAGKTVELTPIAKKMRDEDRGFMVALVFGDRAEREVLLKKLGVPAENGTTFVDGRLVNELINA